MPWKYVTKYEKTWEIYLMNHMYNTQLASVIINISHHFTAGQESFKTLLLWRQINTNLKNYLQTTYI